MVTFVVMVDLYYPECGVLSCLGVIFGQGWVNSRIPSPGLALWATCGHLV